MECFVRIAFLTLSAVGVLTPLAALADPAPASGLSSESPGGGDVVCGPRCVEFLLNWYGKGDEDLIELTKEIQWPDLEAGTSLDALDAALRKRTIHTYPMRISDTARLQWPHPVVLHVESEDGPDGRPTLGHYVVWLPSSSGQRCNIWSGLEGTRSYSSRDLTEHLSGAILLASPVPISDPSEAVRHVAFPWIYSVGAVVAAGGAMLVVGRSSIVRLLFWIRSHFQKEKKP